MKNKYRLPTHIKPERYKILLKPDLDNFTFSGEETIFINIEKPTQQITLHCAEIEIENAEIVLNGVDSRVGKVSYDPKAETAGIIFDQNLPKGKCELKLVFGGILNDKMRGFYRSKYEHQGQVKHLATTQFESTDARRAFPCFDEPSHKAIFDVSLIIPKDMTAISNTIETQILEHEAGLKIVEFESTPKMSTYILAFLVGHFEYIQGRTRDGVLVRVFTTPGKKLQAKFALEVGMKCLEFYNNYFKIDYPLPVLDMIAIPDFAAGAMENWGAVTYRESTLLIDKESSSTANKQWVAMVIAHELAHMWFGNLVTMEWWTHLWLNEGFASFIEYLAIDHIFPDWDIWTQFVANEAGVAYQLDALENTHPIEVEVVHPAEISEIFDKVSYSKGATILRMLHEYLGAVDFQKGLQNYLKKHSFSNTQTEDLWKALQESSGKPVTKVMKNWTSTPGHPVVTVSEQGKKLKLIQSRFFSSAISKRKSKDKTIWNIPIDGVLMDKKIMVIPNKGTKLNKGEVSFFRTEYPFEYLKNLKPNTPSDRLGLIRDAFALAQAGKHSTAVALELALNYKNEIDFTLWAELTAHISQLTSLLFFEPFYPQFKQYGVALYKDIVEKVEWTPKRGEKHTVGILRGMVLQKLGQFGDEETILRAGRLFKKSREDGVKIDPNLRGVVYNLVAENGGVTQFNILVRMYKSEDNQQERERIGRSLGFFKGKELLQKTLDFAVSKHVRYQNSLGIIVSVWSNPEGRYLAWEFVKKNWKLLKERYAGGHYFTRVFGPAGEFTKISDAKDIEQFVKKNPTPEVQRTIAQALEQIYANAECLKRDKKTTQTYLKSFQM